MSPLEKAIAVALDAHNGQVDKAGSPYILHPLRLMLTQRTDDERMAAVLHDVVEDSPWTLERLRAEGFPESVITAVDALTRRDSEDYEAFVLRAGQHPIARAVKLADLHDNCDLSRLSTITDKDRARLAKYQRAIKLLE